jgi:hypothetical protein
MTNTAPPLPNPERCLWCGRKSPDVVFDESHVLPECVGNQNQQVLPPGIVCKPCNSYFGSKVEPALLADPIFHVIVVFLQVVDPDDMKVFRERMFDAAHPAVGGVNRHLDLKIAIKDQKIGINVTHSLSGLLERRYERRDLALLSRALHKIAFESLAWQIFVPGLANPPDLYSAHFDVVRKWTREGQPFQKVRPVLRRPHPAISNKWDVQTWSFGADLGLQVNLFADWYAVSLTSAPDEALKDLRKWVGAAADDMWVLGETLTALKKV